MACAVVGLPQSALALGLGNPRTLSALGQPLNQLFPITLGADEHLDPDCVHVEVLAGETHVASSQLRFRLEGDADGRLRYVRVQSLQRIDEPVVSTTLSLGCPSNVARQFVAFMDPPDVQSAATVADAEPGREVESGSYSPAVRAALATSNNRPQDVLASAPAAPTPVVVAPPPALVPPPAASAPRAKAPAAPPPASAAALPSPSHLAQGPALHRRRPVPAKKAPAAPAPALASAAASAPRSAPQARLHLDAPEILSAAPPAAASAAASGASAAAADNEARLLAQLDRIEAEVGKVRKDNLALQARVHTLQGELDGAESSRYSNPLVWGLGLAVLLLGGASAYLILRMRQMTRDARWWQPPDSVMPAGAAAAPARAAPSVGSAPAPQAAPRTAAVPGLRPIELPEERRAALLAPTTLAAEPEPVDRGGDSILETAPAALLAEPSLQFADTVAPALEPATAPAPLAPTRSAVAPLDEPMTVEELLDMQQQVEFFLVLGQDQAAIEMLEARIATGASSALPYLKLLEIYQQQGDALSFADVGERFSRRFNALAPTWGADLNQGRTLEGYANALQAIQKGWHDAAPSMVLIQNLLTYGDREFATDLTAPEAMEGAHGAGFDLPAYRDLLTLYSVARDLSEQEVRGGEIDLFLPLESGPGAETGTSMMATMVWRNVPPASSFAVPVDIALDEGEPTNLDPGP